MFINADEFFYNLLAYRICWVRGRLGGGKTLLSVALAMELIKKGFARGVIANFPTSLRIHDWREKHEDGKLRGVRGSVVIFDEAGLFIDRRTFMKNDRGIGALLRKLDCFLLLPSVTPPDARLSYFSTQRTMVNYLTGDWHFRWCLAIPGAEPETGEFKLASPHRYYGSYDTRYIPVDDGEYARLWRATVASLGASKLLESMRENGNESEEEEEN